MAYEHFIGIRYLMAKRRSRVVSVITLISIAGVALGVTAMIVVLSVMGGFKKDLKEKILGTKAHIVVESKEDDEIVAPERVLEAAGTFDEIVGASPFIEAEVMASSPTNLDGVMLQGIDPERIGEVSDLDDALEHERAEGKLSYLVDPTPLLEQLAAEREREKRALEEEIEAAQEELDRAREGEEGERPSIFEGGEGPDAGAGPEAGGVESEGPEEEGGMPPIAPPEPAGGEGANAETTPPTGGEEEESSKEQGAEDESGMPSVVDGDDGESDTQEEGSMPSVAGEGTEEESSELPGILIGKELAKSLKVDLGDELNIVTPNADMGPTGPIPRSRPFRVVGIFYTGMYEYDANYAYTGLDEARDFLDREGVSGVELKAADVNRAMPIADEVREVLGAEFDVLDWKEMNRSLFYALRLEKIAMFVVLTFIILVASFSIIAMLIMIVLEKKRDISVLKSMGVPDGGIMRIFIYQGVVIGAVGAAIGLVLGLTICYLLIEFGFPLNSEVYYIATLPVEIDPVEVALVVLCTIFISLVATIYPSWQAANLPPVEGLRYE